MYVNYPQNVTLCLLLIVILSAIWETERPHLRDGPFASSYIFSQIHFHWGKDNMDGSEHRVDGVRFRFALLPHSPLARNTHIYLSLLITLMRSFVRSMPLELHAVHFKGDYKTQEAARRSDDGVSILVYLFQVWKILGRKH